MQNDLCTKAGDVAGKGLANAIAGASYENNAVFEYVCRIGIGFRVNGQLAGPCALFLLVAGGLLQEFVAGIVICVIAWFNHRAR